jgi:hypothetical protein
MHVYRPPRLFGRLKDGFVKSDPTKSDHGEPTTLTVGESAWELYKHYTQPGGRLLLALRLAYVSSTWP